ncbi:MAG: STAS/SEC14 domain-containing protein [Sphingomonadaceae bacterium]|jgi:SpoIIAA-like|nr:STAS/SEC14 domain-containing protein [Sphingomonadaceae bacterium]NCA00751.1 STAS/SEC14 domain-containing protein [Sphingomonadaceae bacterium]
MLDVRLDEEAGFLEITVAGPIHDVDYTQVVTAIDRLLVRHKKLNLVQVIQDIGWIDPSVWWKDLSFHLTHRHFLRRAALVSDAAWVAPLTNLFAPLYPATIKYFPLANLEEARRWAQARDGEDVTTPPLDFA